MAAGVSKKKQILEAAGRLQAGSAGVAELRAIQQELRRAGPAGGATSLSYIAGVLRAAGTPVDYEDRFTDPEIPEPYAARLHGVLRFNDLAGAEDSLRRLDAAFHEYRGGLDRAGERLVRKLALRGKQRAESLAGNPRVGAGKRQEKREIANWFQVWLQSPGLFFEWLAVRKQTDEFRRLFRQPAPDTGEAPAKPPES